MLIFLHFYVLVFPRQKVHSCKFLRFSHVCDHANGDNDDGDEGNDGNDDVVSINIREKDDDDDHYDLEDGTNNKKNG